MHSQTLPYCKPHPPTVSNFFPGENSDTTNSDNCYNIVYTCQSSICCCSLNFCCTAMSSCSLTHFSSSSLDASFFFNSWHLQMHGKWYKLEQSKCTVITSVHTSFEIVCLCVLTTVKFLNQHWKYYLWHSSIISLSVHPHLTLCEYFSGSTSVLCRWRMLGLLLCTPPWTYRGQKQLH